MGLGLGRAELVEDDLHPQHLGPGAIATVVKSLSSGLDRVAAGSAIRSIPFIPFILAKNPSRAFHTADGVRGIAGMSGKKICITPSRATRQEKWPRILKH